MGTEKRYAVDVSFYVLAENDYEAIAKVLETLAEMQQLTADGKIDAYRHEIEEMNEQPTGSIGRRKIDFQKIIYEIEAKMERSPK